MRAIALAVLIGALDRKLPKSEYDPKDLFFNGMVQLVALVFFVICVFSGE